MVYWCISHRTLEPIMLIKLARTSDCKVSEVTPEPLYLSRRAVLGGALAGGRRLDASRPCARGGSLPLR